MVFFVNEPTITSFFLFGLSRFEEGFFTWLKLVAGPKYPLLRLLFKRLDFALDLLHDSSLKSVCFFLNFNN